MILKYHHQSFPTTFHRIIQYVHFSDPYIHYLWNVYKRMTYWWHLQCKKEHIKALHIYALSVNKALAIIGCLQYIVKVGYLQKWQSLKKKVKLCFYCLVSSGLLCSLRITAVLWSSAHFICSSEVIQLLSVVLLYLRYCTGALSQGWHCRWEYYRSSSMKKVYQIAVIYF